MNLAIPLILTLLSPTSSPLALVADHTLPAGGEATEAPNEIEAAIDATEKEAEGAEEFLSELNTLVSALNNNHGSLAELAAARDCHKELNQAWRDYKQLAPPSRPSPPSLKPALTSAAVTQKMSKDPSVLDHVTVALSEFNKASYGDTKTAVQRLKDAVAIAAKQHAAAEARLREAKAKPSTKAQKKRVKQLQTQLQQYATNKRAIEAAALEAAKFRERFAVFRAAQQQPVAPSEAQYQAARAIQIAQVLANFHCSANEVVCLTADGVLLGEAEGVDGKELGIIGRLPSASRVTVQVFVDYEQDPGEIDSASITLKMGSIERTSDLTRALNEGDEQGHERSGRCVTPAHVGYELVKSVVLTVPTDPKVRDGVIEFERTINEKLTARNQHAFRIEHGRYFVSGGLLLAMVPGGERELVATNEGGAQRVMLDTSFGVSGAVALNVFPGGRRKSVISPFEDLRCDSRLDSTALSKCQRGRRRRFAADLIGLQLGLDLKANIGDQFYFGVALEPVVGLTLSAGLALVKLPGLPSGVVEGQLVTSESDLEARSRFVPRFYFGPTLSVDLIKLFQNIRTSATSE